MINKNQYEKSVLFLKKNLPTYIRNAYTEFVKVLDEFVSQLTVINEENPATVNQVCGEILADRKFMFAYNSLFSNELLQKKFMKVIQATEILDSDNKGSTVEEDFENVNGSDIYAPVKRIVSRFTPFAYNNKYDAKSTDNDDSNREMLSISYEIDDSYINSYNGTNQDLHPEFESVPIEGFNGVKTVFDDLRSSCVVDIVTLFDKFFDEWEDKNFGFDNRYFEYLSDLVKELKENSNRANEIIEKVTTLALSTATVTYFVYASKLIGAKNDIFSWMYTAFVKDSVSHIDKTFYPTKAPITIASGHGLHGKWNEDPKPDSTPNDVMEQQAVWLGSPNENSDAPCLNDAVKANIYRSIRLQYSTWATTINAILGRAYLQTEKYTSFKRPSEVDLTSPSEKQSVINFVITALGQYLKARYRTYNTSIQLDLNGQAYQSVKNIPLAVDKIKDEETTAITKEIVFHNLKVNDVFIQNTGNDSEKILALNNTATTSLARLFLYGSYLYMLQGVHEHTGKLYEEIDETTGKTKRELFEEIYYGIINHIRSILNNDLCDPDSLQFMSFAANEINVINTAGRYLTVLNADSQIGLFTDVDEIKAMLKSLQDYSSEKDIVSEELNKLNSTKNPGEDKWIKEAAPYMIIDIPLLTEYAYLEHPVLKLNGENAVSTSYSKTIGYKENSEFFPKNKVIIEALDRMNDKGSVVKVFKSLESADEMISSLESSIDLAGEGADAMASNACYSAFGSIGGGVCSLELTSVENPSNTKKEEIVIGGISNPTETLNPNTPTDGNDMVMPESSSDPIDQQELTKGTSSESARIDLENQVRYDISERYNKLFNKFILGMK